MVDGQILGRGRDLAGIGDHRPEFSGTEENLGAVADAVVEVTGAGGKHVHSVRDTSLISHAQRATGDLDAGAHGAVDREKRFFLQFYLVHAGWRADPGTHGRVELLAAPDLGGGAEMADIGHAGAEEDVLNRRAGDLGEELDIVRIVGAGEDRLGDFGQVDLDDRRIFSGFVGFEQLRLGQPGVDRIDAILQRLRVLIAFLDHLLHQGDVGAQVGGDTLLRQLDAAGGGAALGSGVGQLESLLDGEFRQPFHLEDAAIEDVLLVLLRHGEQPLLDRPEGDGVDRVAQGDAGVEFALESHQDALRHVQRHETEGAGEGDQAGAGREADADGEAGVAVAAGADGVGEQQAVQPAVNDAVAGAQGNAAAGGDEVGQGIVHLHVGRFRIGGGMAEGLHEHRRLEFKAGELGQFVGSHRPGGVLGADGGHLRLAGGSGQYAGDTAGFANHFLRQGIALVRLRCRILRHGKHIGVTHAQSLARLFGQGATDNERDAAAGAVLVSQSVRLYREGGDNLALLVEDFTFFRIDGDDIPGVHLGDVHGQRQSAGVLGGVEEDRGDDAADDDATALFIRHRRDSVADMPEHAVAGALAGGAGADDIADEGYLEALLAEFGDGFQPAGEAGLAHGQGVQRDIGAAPGVAGRGKIVGVDLAVDLEHLHLDDFGHACLVLEPIGSGPRLHDRFGSGVALRQGRHFIKGIIDEGNAGERTGGIVGQRRVLEGIDQRLDVVAADHCAEDDNGFFFGHQRRTGFPLENLPEKVGFYLGCRIDARGDALLQQVQQELFLPIGGILQQFDQILRLVGIERQGRDPLGVALFLMP